MAIEFDDPTPWRKDIFQSIVQSNQDVESRQYPDPFSPSTPRAGVLGLMKLSSCGVRPKKMSYAFHMYVTPKRSI